MTKSSQSDPIHHSKIWKVTQMTHFQEKKTPWQQRVNNRNVRDLKRQMTQPVPHLLAWWLLFRVQMERKFFKRLQSLVTLPRTVGLKKKTGKRVSKMGSLKNRLQGRSNQERLIMQCYHNSLKRWTLKLRKWFNLFSKKWTKLLRSTNKVGRSCQ